MYLCQKSPSDQLRSAFVHRVRHSLDAHHQSHLAASGLLARVKHHCVADSIVHSFPATDRRSGRCGDGDGDRVDRLKRACHSVRNVRAHDGALALALVLVLVLVLDPNDHRQAALPPGTPGAVPPPTPSPAQDASPARVASPAAPVRPIVRAAPVGPASSPPPRSVPSPAAPVRPAAVGGVPGGVPVRRVRRPRRRRPRCPP